MSEQIKCEKCGKRGAMRFLNVALGRYVYVCRDCWKQR